MKINSNGNEHKISSIGITDDTLTGRGGLAFYDQYLNSSKILEIIENRIGHLRKSGKSKQISEIVRQLLIFFADGSYKAISALDVLKGDEGYAACIERHCNDLISGSMATRFFKKVSGTIYRLLRKIINDIFIWRLQVEKPQKVVLHLDTMVLENDYADKREGVKVTYKKVCGFQPLQINWGPYIVDMDFRSGEKHSNHGDDAKHAVKRLVELIRAQYDKDVPIIISADSGFLSEENLIFFEENLNIHYVVIGRSYDSVYRPVLEDLEKQECGVLERGNAAWVCFDYESKLNSWKKMRRTVLTGCIPILWTSAFII